DRTVSFTTFLGPFGEYSAVTAIAVDSSGNSYVTGWTASMNFPVHSAQQPSSAGSVDAFVTKLTSTGAIAFSTYWGGNGGDNGTGIAVDSTGVFVTGNTSSTNFPTISAYRLVYQGETASAGFSGDIKTFVTAFSPTGNLSYSTLLGSLGGAWGNGIAIDQSH